MYFVQLNIFLFDKTYLFMDCSWLNLSINSDMKLWILWTEVNYQMQWFTYMHTLTTRCSDSPICIHWLPDAVIHLYTYIDYQMQSFTYIHTLCKEILSWDLFSLYKMWLQFVTFKHDDLKMSLDFHLVCSTICLCRLLSNKEAFSPKTVCPQRNIYFT